MRFPGHRSLGCVVVVAVLMLSTSASGQAQPTTEGREAGKPRNENARAVWADSDWCATLPPKPDPEGFYSTDVWPAGIVPFRFVSNPQHSLYVTPEQQQKMLDAFATLSGVANIQFVPWTNEPDVLEIRTDNNPNCVFSFSSGIGYAGGVQNVTICIHHWDIHGLLMHEVMHALGLWHEHQREDRDPYIQVHPSLATNGGYSIIPNPPWNANLHGLYDFASLMHYQQVGTVNGHWERAITILEPYARAWQWEIGTFLRPDARPSNGDTWVLQFLYGGTPPPRAFALQSPAGGAPVGAAWTPEFTWAPSEEATNYRLQVDDTPVFDSPLIDTQTAQTTYTHGVPLDANRLYWWRVTASNAVGEAESHPLRFMNFYTAAAYPAALYVDDSAPASGDGSSWAEPLSDLALATDLAYASDGITTEIRVAQGVYTPDFSSGDRLLSFWLSDGCALLGGYAGYGAPTPNQRDIDLFETVLSGDLNADDLPGFVNIEDNSRHVVFSLSNPSTTLLEGFTIRGGRAEIHVSIPGFGAGLVVDGGNPVIRRCRFQNNHAEHAGAGMCILFIRAAPTIDRCTFVNNRAQVTGAPHFYDSQSGGGGLRGFNTGAFTITDCVFEGNTADAGGAAAFTYSNPTIANALMVGNTATAVTGNSGGGALWFGLRTISRIVNATLVDNASATDGGAIFMVPARIRCEVLNSILWRNMPDQVSGNVILRYSDIEGGASGTGNINADPRFVGPGNGKYRISGGSPVIDAGDNTSVPAGVTTDLDGDPRFVDDPGTPNTGVPGGAGGVAVVDMGAYELQGESCYADCDISTGAGVLDLFDFLCFQGSFVAGEAYACDCDTNTGPLVCDLFDFLCFQSAFVGGCP